MGLNLKKVSPLLRFAVSFGLLAFLFSRFDMSPVKERLLHFHPLFYLAGILLIFIYVYVQSLILVLLFRFRGQTASVWAVMRLTIISSFFGVFLPGGVGSDVVLCYNLFKSSLHRETVLSTIVFARLATLLGMVLIAFAASFSPLCSIPGLRTLSLAILLGVAAAYGFLTWRRSTEVSGRMLAFMKEHRFTAFLYRVLAILAEAGKDRRALLAVGPMFVAIGVFRILLDILSSRALGLSIPPTYFFIFAPVVTIVSVVPLTVAGLGVREGTYIGLFKTVGVLPADAMAISLVSFSFTLWVCLAGAILYMVTGLNKPETDERKDSQ